MLSAKRLSRGGKTRAKRPWGSEIRRWNAQRGRRRQPRIWVGGFVKKRIIRLSMVCHWLGGAVAQIEKCLFRTDTSYCNSSSYFSSLIRISRKRISSGSVFLPTP